MVSSQIHCATSPIASSWRRDDQFNYYGYGRGSVGPSNTHISSQKAYMGTNARYGEFWSYRPHLVASLIASYCRRGYKLCADGGS